MIMIDLPFEPLAKALNDSDFIRTLLSIKGDYGVEWALAGERVRPLRKDEVQLLVFNGNTAEDWSQVKVAEGFQPVRVRDSEFRGQVTLGRFERMIRGPGGLEAASGVLNSTISNCVIGHDSLVHNVALLASYVVGGRASVFNCGRVICNGPTTFGNGVRIPIGAQCGGRWLRSFAEITLDVADLLTSGKTDKRFEERYTEFLAEYLQRARSVRGVIGPGAMIAHVPVIQNVYIGPGAELDAATRIENATLLSSFDEQVQVRDGACISDSLLQWGSRVCGPAVLERTVLLEHSQVERFGKVIDSVIGPNSAVGGAEVTGCLVGPFVGSHHQGLLIAARWPAGRGNLGYGAAVGCNHTSRAPDQEAVLGEGLFIGLGVKIQYPVDLSGSPYSVLACGVSLPPQKLSFPFSLVRPATEAIPGKPFGANILIPGWVLSENLYAVQRSVMKFRTRDQARRHKLANGVFRPEIMALVEDALLRLEKTEEVREVYSDYEIPGLGRNVMLERHRLAAIRCYAEHLDRFRLLCTLDCATRALVADPLNRSLLRGEVEVLEPWGGLSRLKGLLEAFGTAVERSKARDEERGPLVIEDYAITHEPTREDSVVRQTWEEIRLMQKHLAQVLAVLSRQTTAPTISHEATAPLVGTSWQRASLDRLNPVLASEKP